MTSTDHHAPSVSIDFELPDDLAIGPDAPDSEPDGDRPRRWLPVLTALAVAAVAVLFAVLRTDAPPAAAPTDDVADEGPAPAALAQRADEAGPMVVVDTVADRGPIVPDGDQWLTVIDETLMRSTDLLEWQPDERVVGPVAIAVASTSNGPEVLTAQTVWFDAIEIENEELRDYGATPANRPPRMGAIDEVGWTAVADIPSIGRLLVVSDDVEAAAYDIGILGDVTSIALSGELALITTTDDGQTTSLHSIRRDLAGAPTWCTISDLPPVSLATAGDGAVHLLDGARAWAVVPGSEQLELAVDAANLALGFPVEVRPLTTGDGWSAIVSHSREARVYLSDDGVRFERLGYPTVGTPTQVIWANVGADKGVGISFVTSDGRDAVAQVADPGARHPTRANLQRTLDLDRPDATMPFRGDGVACAPVEVSVRRIG